MLRLSLIVLTGLVSTACATVPPAPPGQLAPCKFLETGAQPCQRAVWLDGPAFELQRQERLQRSISELCSGSDAGCLDLTL